MSDMPTRQQALDLLRQYNSQDRALKHALAVEAAMRHLADRHGGDPEVWGLVGLLHDLDYEQFPQQHCAKTAEILRANGYPELVIRAAVSHGWAGPAPADGPPPPPGRDVAPETLMEKALYAVDELTGLVTACALVRPSKSVMDLEVRSVRKKWKEKGFAAGVDRAVIERGAALLGTDPDALIGEVIAALRSCAARLGLAG